MLLKQITGVQDVPKSHTDIICVLNQIKSKFWYVYLERKSLQDTKLLLVRKFGANDKLNCYMDNKYNRKEEKEN